jgi:hypothetical protein
LIFVGLSIKHLIKKQMDAIALESEWHDDQDANLLEVFYKLLDTKAILKVYVFESTLKKFDYHITLLTNQLRLSRLMSERERYLLISQINLKRSETILY